MALTLTGSSLRDDSKMAVLPFSRQIGRTADLDDAAGVARRGMARVNLRLLKA